MQPLRQTHIYDKISAKYSTCAQVKTNFFGYYCVTLLIYLSDEVLMWLSAWSEVQIVCIWSVNATAIPKPHRILPHLNPDWFYLSGTGLPRLS